MTVLLVGAAGQIGRLLCAGLSRDLRTFDLPRHDARDRAALRAATDGVRQIVHLGWDMTTENYRNNRADPANIAMAANVLDIALDLKLDRVVLASSVHAGRLQPHAPWPIRPSGHGAPATPYGRSKLHIEGLGRAAAREGLQVVAIRFGGVQSVRPRDPAERGLWLSNADCVSAVRAGLDAPLGPDNWALIHAVSRGIWRRHCLRNSLGWSPLRPPTG